MICLFGNLFEVIWLKAISDRNDTILEMHNLEMMGGEDTLLFAFLRLRVALLGIKIAILGG
jgi:hypothetical protein